MYSMYDVMMSVSWCINVSCNYH